MDYYDQEPMALGSEGQANAFAESEQIAAQFSALLEKGDFDAATRLYMHAGEAVGFPLINRFAQNADMSRRLANVFFRAKDYDKAAQICENLGEDQKAAELYDHSGNALAAAECYQRLGEKSLAADRFEKCGHAHQAADLFLELGEHVRAAINFEKASEVFEAGRNYFRGGQEQRALELLQQVPAGSPDELEAVGMISTVLERKGYAELAARRLHALFEQHAIDADSLELGFHLGELELAQGHRDAARAAFEKVANINFGFRDVGDKLKVLQAPADPAAMPEGPMSGAPRHATSEITLVAPEIEDVAKFPVFSELSLPQVRAMYALAETREYQQGDVVIEEGQPGQGLFLVKDGLLRVHLLDDDGSELTVANFPRGAHFGDMTLLDEAPTAGRVVATRQTVVLHISKDRFTAMLQADPALANGVYKAMIRTLCARLRATTRKLLMTRRELSIVRGEPGSAD